MLDFDFAAPESLAEAVQLLGHHADAERPMAGDTDLMDYVRTERAAPQGVVNLKRIPELNILAVDSSGRRLGTAVPCYKIYQHPEICRHFTTLIDACSIIGGIQIQSRVSIGGNLCNAASARPDY